MSRSNRNIRLLDNPLMNNSNGAIAVTSNSKEVLNQINDKLIDLVIGIKIVELEYLGEDVEYIGFFILGVEQPYTKDEFINLVASTALSFKQKEVMYINRHHLLWMVDLTIEGSPCHQIKSKPTGQIKESRHAVDNNVKYALCRATSTYLNVIGF